MKNLVFLALLFNLLFNPLKAQNYGFEMKLDNFEQVSEYKFQFEAYIKKTELSSPFAIENFQFNLVYDAAILNGGIFHDDFLEFDNTGSALVGLVKSGTFVAQSGNRLLYASDDAGNSGSAVTVLGDSWSYIGLFSVSLRKDGEFHNFGNADPKFGFRLDPTMVYTILTRCDYVGSPGNFTKSGTAFYPVTNRILHPENGQTMSLRQIAGFWFYGDGDWSNAANWNQTLKAAYPAYVQEVPSANANAIINGNVTIPTALDVSLLPNGGGNGGEVTVLTGEAPVFTLTVQKNGNQFIFVTIYADDQATDLGTSVQLAAGTTVYLSTWRQGGPGQTFFGWYYPGQGPPYFTTEDWHEFVMPASNVTAIAGWSSGSKSFEYVGGNSAKSLYASLTIVPGASLTVDKLFNDNSNGATALIVKSDATGTGYLVHNNPGVLATVERFLSEGKYHYVSSPVTNAPYSLFQAPLPVPPAFADFFEWVERNPVPGDPPFWVNLNYPYNNPPVGTLAPGKGYAVAYSDANYTKEFVGPLNVGTVTFDATYTPGASSPYWNHRGFNLTGNPYATALDADALLNAHSNIYGLYFWDEAANYEGDRNDYATYSLAGGVGTSPGGALSHTPDGVIAPGQGFMAQVKSTPFASNADITITYTNAMRITDDSWFYKEQGNRDRIWLSVTGPQSDYNEILVAFMEGAEVGMDRTDAEKIKGNEKLAFYSMLDEVEFVIQGFPMIGSEDTYEVALGLDAGFAGQYTFNAELIENFDQSVNITLEDRVASKIINLRSTPQYVAQVAAPGEIRNRFFLHFNGPTSVSVIDQKLTKVYALQNQIFIQNNGNSPILDVEVVNTLGQVISRTRVNATEAVVNVPGRNVVYIVKVRTSEGIESHKLLIR